jgi:hypothetical protein
MIKVLQYTVLLFCSLGLASEAARQQLVINTRNIDLLIEEWNIIHNARSLKGFSNVYDQKLLFYGERMTRKKAIALKDQLFSSKPEFRQRITTEIKYSLHTTGIIKCEFIKEAWENSEWKPYSCYLLIGFKDSRFWIVGESDYVTDKTLGYILDIGEELQMEQISQKLATDTVSVAAPQDTNTAGSQVVTSDELVIRKEYIYMLVGLLIFGGIILFIGLSIASRSRKKKKSRTASPTYAEPVYEPRQDYAYEPRPAVEYEAKPVTNDYFKTRQKEKFSPEIEKAARPLEPEKIQVQPPAQLVSEINPDPPVTIGQRSQPIVQDDLGVNEEPYHIIESHLKQSAFRDYIISLFEVSKFAFRKPKNQSSYPENGDDLEPLLEFYSTTEPGEPNFAVQTIYTEDTGEGQIKLFSEASHQFINQFAGEFDLYYLIGVGGPPEKPNGIYLIPAQKLTNHVISKESLKTFRKSGMFVYYHGKLL